MTSEIINSVFKAYDIRGKTPDQLNEGFFLHLGKAYATKFAPKRVAVGNDIRPESVLFKKALIKGLLDSGVDVVDIGEIATEMLYFTVGEYYDQFDGGLTVTASHNPPGWNGCKMVGPESIAIGKATGLFDLRDIMLSGEYTSANTRGSLDTLDVYPAFKNKVRSFIKSSKRPEINVVVDAGNGIGGKVYDYVFGDMENVKLKRLYFEPDGNFPNHVPDPLKEENVMEIKKLMSKSNVLDMGIAIDGDADRVFFIDKTGRRPTGVYTGVILAKKLLKEHPGSYIVHDPRNVWPFEKESLSLGGKTDVSIAGHSYFKQKMRDINAIFGAEMSSHYYYKDFYYCDSGMITIALMFDLVFEGADFTDQLNYFFETYPISGEVNYKVEDASGLFKKMEETYSSLDPEVSKIDGVSIAFNDWRFNLRSSNTEPIVRLNVEARNKDLLVEKFKEVENLIGAPRVNSPELLELK